MSIYSRKLIFKSNSLVKTLSSNLSLTLSDAPKYVSNIKEKVIYKKFDDLNSWYTRIIGLDEVKLYQTRVVDLQEKLLTAQERRREVGLALSLIRKKSNELQDQLHKVKRQDDLQRFLDIMRDETEILKQEKEMQGMFVNCDREEREIFTAFTNAIRDSHEKQRAQLEYTKYLGLILSIIGSFLAFSYSTLRKNDLKGFIENRLDEITSKQISFAPIIENLTKELQENTKNNKIMLTDIKNNSNQIKELKNQYSSSKAFVDYLPKKQTLVEYGIYSLLGYIALKALL